MKTAPTIRFSLFASVMLVLGACTSGGPEPVEGAVGSSGQAATPLPRLDVEEWASAIAGCEGAIDGSESYAVARHDGLVVAMHGGVAFCVDTLPALQEELIDLGLEDHADALEQGYWAAFPTHTLAAETSPTSSPRAAEPNPQPSIDTGCAVRTFGDLGPSEGEPNPQPSDPKTDEPNPQPSRPGGSSSNET